MLADAAAAALALLLLLLLISVPMPLSQFDFGLQIGNGVMCTRWSMNGGWRGSGGVALGTKTHTKDTKDMGSQSSVRTKYSRA